MANSAGNMHARAMIGFGFTSDSLKKWCENFEPITEWSNHKPFSNSLITFDTQLKTALIQPVIMIGFPCNTAPYVVKISPNQPRLV